MKHVYYRLIVMKEEFIKGMGYREVVVGNHVYMLEGDIDFEYFDDILWHLMLDHGYAVKVKEIDEPSKNEEVNAFTSRGKSYSFGYIPDDIKNEVLVDQFTYEVEK